MRWFKHLSAARRDERIAEYMSSCGKDAIEGYGFWWMLLEVIAEQVGNDNKCSATYSLPQWSHHLYSHHHKVSKYLGKLEGSGLVRVKKIEGRLEVAIPNLLKYRDEYSKKSGQTKDKVRSKKQIQNTDTDTDTEKTKTASPTGDGLAAVEMFKRNFRCLLPSQDVVRDIQRLVAEYGLPAVEESFVAANSGHKSFAWAKSRLRSRGKFQDEDPDSWIREIEEEERRANERVSGTN